MNAAPPFDLRAFAGGFASAWRTFFFTPVDPRICAGLRIGYSVAILINLACWHADLARWFGAEGVLPADDARLIVPVEQWSLLFWLPPSDAVLQGAFWIFALQAVLLLFGCASRVNAVCVLIWLMSFQHRNPLLWDGEDTLLRLMGWYLMLMPIGQAWTWRDLFRRRAAPYEPVTAWGLRLLQIQMAVIFLTAGWHKLDSEMWRQGYALYYVGRLDDYFGRAPWTAWLFDSAWSVRPLTWLVIAMELATPLLVWFKQTRRWALAAALVFHLGNELTMHLYLFHWVMLLGWSSFLLPQDFAWRRRGL